MEERRNFGRFGKGTLSSHDQVARALGIEILAGTYPPGTKLPPEAEMLARFGISRTVLREGGLAAIVVTASGCGTTIKDYGFMLRGDPAYAERAARVSALARDISEVLIEADLPPGDGRGLTVAYHAACSLQHGQKVVDAPKRLLAAAGYVLRTPIEAHLCCGSAGTYNILQPEIAGQLGDRKAGNIARLDADVVATGNIGCAMQLAPRLGVPVLHTIELIDWATGGPAPACFANHTASHNGSPR